MKSKYILIALFIGLLSYNSYAEEVFNINVDEKIKEGIDLGADNVNLKRIPEEILNNAKKSLELIPKSEVEKYMKSMDYNPDTGVITFNENNIINKSEIKKVNKYFGRDERIYIFISSSMPNNLLKTYCKDVHNLGIGENAIFVLRGCVNGGGFNGCKDFRPTIDFIKSFISNDKKEVDKTCKIWIDPVLFKKYEVKVVPTFIYANNVMKNIELGSEGDYSLLDSIPVTYKSVGDWSLSYHIEELKKLSNSKSLKEISDSLAEQ